MGQRAVGKSLIRRAAPSLACPLARLPANPARDTSRR
jgi:hypothetical protein